LSSVCAVLTAKIDYISNSGEQEREHRNDDADVECATLP